VTAIGLLFLISACIYGVWRVLLFSATKRQGWAGVWRLACVIACLRIAAFGIGTWSLQSSGWMQSVGYILILAGLPEIYAAKALRSDTAAWFGAGCALLTGSSILWAALFRLAQRRADQAG
jgi:hypothetical protein